MSNEGAPDPKIYYAEKLAQHGATPESVDVTRDGQRLRFKIILDALGETHNCSILDVGCGYGAFYSYLIDDCQRYSISYSGVDICDPMIQAAKSHRPNVHFATRDIVTDPLPQSYDFVVASGLFQFNHSWGPAEALIKAMWQHTRHTLVFNMLSVDTPMDENWVNEEFHVEPERAIHFCRSLTKYWSAKHDYRLNDFTIIMRREPIQIVG